jgi:hypothetical protein
MATYAVIPQWDGSYDVEMIGPNGFLQIIPGFATADATQAWIDQDKRLADKSEPRKPGGFRTPWRF